MMPKNVFGEQPKLLPEDEFIMKSSWNFGGK